MLTRHADAVATVRAFAERSGALRVVLLVDAGAEATMLDCAPDGALELTDAGRTFEIPAAAPVDAAPRALPDVVHDERLRQPRKGAQLPRASAVAAAHTTP